MSSDDSSTDRGLRDHPVEMILVAALDEQRTIGRDGDLPWHLPADLRHFKKVTVGHPVVMGRKTFESLGGALPGRLNLVLTNQQGYEVEDGQVVKSLAEALEVAGEQGGEKVMILGGAGVFAQALPEAAEMILTVVHGEYEGDTFFPDFEGDQWEIVDQISRPADGRNEAAMTFVTLRPRTGQGPRTVGDADRAGPLPSILELKAP